MKTIKTLLPKAAIMLLMFTLLCGVVYTGLITGFAQLIFPQKANGSIIEVDGKKYGCALLGQQYTDAKHMALLDGLELLPPLTTEYRGIKLHVPECGRNYHVEHRLSRSQSERKTGLLLSGVNALQRTSHDLCNESTGIKGDHQNADRIV